MQDLLVTTKGIQVQDDAAMKAMPYRIVAMLTRMATKSDGLAESSAERSADIDDDQRYAERESQTEESPQP